MKSAALIVASVFLLSLSTLTVVATSNHEPLNFPLVQTSCRGSFEGKVSIQNLLPHERSSINGNFKAQYASPESKSLFVIDGFLNGTLTVYSISNDIISGSITGEVSGTLNTAQFLGSATGKVDLRRIPSGLEGYQGLNGVYTGECSGRYQTSSQLTGLSDSSRIKLEGSLAEDYEVIMKVRSDQPIYLRGAAFDYYSGKEWIRTLTSITKVLQAKAGTFVGLITQNPNASGSLSTVNVEILRHKDNILYTPMPTNAIVLDTNAAISIDPYDTIRIIGADDILGSFQPQVRKYSAVEAFGQPSTATGRATTTIPAEIREIYLQLPDRLPSRIRELAENLTRPFDNPYQKAVAIKNFLRDSGNFRYSLDVSAPPADSDAVDYFLFESKNGYSFYFASAMVVLSRAAGLPARFVTVYTPGTFNATDGAYSIRNKDAHGYAELYFPENGWIGFEATAGWSDLAPRPTISNAQYSVPIISRVSNVEYPAGVYRGVNFEVNGNVEVLIPIFREGHFRIAPPVIQIPVVLSLENASGSGQRIIIGNSFASGAGVFSSVAIVSKIGTAPPGHYLLVARTIDAGNIQGSWSIGKDITVKSKTNLIVQTNSNGTSHQIVAKLTDDSSIPIPHKRVALAFNGIALGEQITDINGVFTTTLRKNTKTDNLTVVFVGTESYDPAIISLKLVEKTQNLREQDKASFILVNFEPVYYVVLAAVGIASALVLRKKLSSQVRLPPDQDADDRSKTYDARQEIVQIYLSLRKNIGASGLDYEPYLTPWEWYSKVVEKRPEMEQSLKFLTEELEKNLYVKHLATEKDVVDIREAANKILTTNPAG